MSFRCIDCRFAAPRLRFRCGGRMVPSYHPGPAPRRTPQWSSNRREMSRPDGFAYPTGRDAFDLCCGADGGFVECARRVESVEVDRTVVKTPHESPSTAPR